MCIASSSMDKFHKLKKEIQEVEGMSTASSNDEFDKLQNEIQERKKRMKREMESLDRNQDLVKKLKANQEMASHLYKSGLRELEKTMINLESNQQDSKPSPIPFSNKEKTSMKARVDLELKKVKEEEELKTTNSPSFLFSNKASTSLDHSGTKDAYDSSFSQKKQANKGQNPESSRGLCDREKTAMKARVDSQLKKVKEEEEEDEEPETTNSPPFLFSNKGSTSMDHSGAKDAYDSSFSQKKQANKGQNPESRGNRRPCNINNREHHRRRHLRPPEMSSSIESVRDMGEGTSSRPPPRRPAPPRRQLPQPHHEYPMPPPPPRHAWMRGRMQGFPAQINLYVRDDVIRQIPVVLARVGGEALVRRFLEGPFCDLLHINRRASANNALHELLARELHDSTFSQFERWFHVGGHDIRFSVQEYALVTGLSFGNSRFNPGGRHIIPRTSLFYTRYNGKKTKANMLKDDFNNEDELVFGTPEQYVKAANLLMYYFILLARDNPLIDDWAWALVEDETEWDCFPWGSWSFQILCHQLGVMKKDPGEIGNDRGAYHLYGPVWALNIWAYEAIPELGRACGRRLNDDLMPRLRRWATFQSSLNFGNFFDNPQLNPHVTLVPGDIVEVMTPAFQSLDCPDPLALRFITSQRHSFKKLPEEQRKSKAKREMARVVENLKCQDTAAEVPPRRRASRPTRAASEGRARIPERVEISTPMAHSKCPRPESLHPSPGGLTCCVHGDPCRHGRSSDDWVDNIADRLWSHWERDTSATGIVDRIARAVARELKGLLGSRSSHLGHKQRSRDIPTHSGCP